MNTGCGKIINWTRPIKNFEKRLEFQKEIDRPLHENKLEHSKSLWCHPLVITENKSGRYGFTVDLTRLYNLVI